MNKPIREGFADPDEREPAKVTPLKHAPEPPTIDATFESENEWPIRVKLLHKAVRNGKGDMVNELVFREPTGGDINRFGNPCRVDQYGEVIIDDRRMLPIIATLSGVLQPFLEAMDPRDYNSCAYRLRGFFLPNPAAW
jgi:Phage tail assembly chaperone proteins, E, or 41 or 14